MDFTLASPRGSPPALVRCVRETRAVPIGSASIDLQSEKRERRPRRSVLDLAEIAGRNVTEEKAAVES